MRKVASATFQNATALNSIKAPDIGYLNHFWIRVTGTLNLSAGGALKYGGPFNLLKRIQVESNEGGTDHVNVSGIGMNLSNMVSLARGFRPDRAGTGDTTPHADLYAAGVNSGNNTWTLWYKVPIALNDKRNREVGLVNLQARELQLNIKLTTEDVANVVTNVGTGFTGSIDIFYGHYGVPQHFDGAGNMLVTVPPLVRVRTVEQVDVISSAGQAVNVEIPHDGALVRLIHEVVINGARSDAYDGLKLIFNDDNNPYDWDRGLLRMAAREHYNIELPVGVCVQDFLSSTQDVGDGDTPDLIDTRNIALIQSRVQVSSTATLGSNNNYIRTIRTYVQRARRA
jgi:hypothetical protein